MAAQYAIFFRTIGLIDGSAHHAADFVAKLFDLRECRILGRTVRSITYCYHRYHTIIPLLLRRSVQNNGPLSFRALASCSSS